MKFLVVTLLAGSSLVSADMPNVGYDQCVMVSQNIAQEDATFTNPDPETTAMRLFLYCGQQTISDTGYSSNDPGLKWMDLDEEQAQMILDAAQDLVTDDENIFVQGG